MRTCCKCAGIVGLQTQPVLDFLRRCNQIAAGQALLNTQERSVVDGHGGGPVKDGFGRRAGCRAAYTQAYRMEQLSRATRTSSPSTVTAPSPVCAARSQCLVRTHSALTEQT